MPEKIKKLFDLFESKIAASKKFHYYLFVVTFFLILSCATRQPYILSNFLKIQELEKRDHEVCTSLKLNFDRANNLQSKLYWRCRLSFAKFRLNVRGTALQQDAQNFEINDLITKISLQLANSPDSILLQENKKMDSRQHAQCLSMGFITESEDQAKIDDYFACRKALLEDQQLIPPYGNTDYLRYQNNSYNLGFIIDQRIKELIKRYEEAKSKYPACIKFNVKSENFKKCTEGQDKSRKCFSEINHKKFMRDGEEKLACQKQAYIRFSDDLLKEDDSKKEEIKRQRQNSDYSNKQNFAAIGVDNSQFFTETKKTKAQKKEEQRLKNEKINSQLGLYTRYEINKLRQKFIFSCQQEANKRVKKYEEGLIQSCEDMKKFEVLGESTE